MVKQKNLAETSSTVRAGLGGAYSFRSVTRLRWQLPTELELGSHVQQNLAGGLSSYTIFAKPGDITADPARWKATPHRVFVNLPASTTPELGLEIVEPKAMLGFSKRYGLLEHNTVNDRWVLQVQSTASLGYISSTIEGFGPEEFGELIRMKSQALLRFAWKTGDKRVRDEIGRYTAQELQAQVDIATGAVVLNVANAWTLICMLFLRDHAAGKTAVCANPECPAPYFLKSRKTQKICEAGECVAWAQRNYALRWWRENESKASKGKLEGKAK
jgi:hypothetical protein